MVSTVAKRDYPWTFSRGNDLVIVSAPTWFAGRVEAARLLCCSPLDLDSSRHQDRQ
jgi:hypothetical protein